MNRARSGRWLKKCIVVLGRAKLVRKISGLVNKGSEGEDGMMGSYFWRMLDFRLGLVLYLSHLSKYRESFKYMWPVLGFLSRCSKYLPLLSAALMLTRRQCILG